MVGLAGQDLVGTVELLEQDDSGQLMGQRDRSEREPVVHVAQIEAVRASDHEAQVKPGLAALLQEAAEGDRVERLAVAVEQRDERAIGDPLRHPLVLSDLDQLEAGVAGQQLLVVLDVVGKRGAQPTHGDDEKAHDEILGPMEDPERGERRINIHFSPEIMAGSYANFANVSHSDYEFTITFARVDHEVEEEEIPGVVVSRINLSPRFMRELIDAMQDNFSKWETREGIKNLPEFGGPSSPTGPADED